MKTYTLIFDGTGTDLKTLRGGNYFLYMVGLLPITVQLYNAGSLVGDLTSIQAGIGFRRRAADGTLQEFNEVRVTSASAQTIQVGVGYGDIDNNAISISSQLTSRLAPVADDALISTGNAYMGFARQAAVAAQNSHVQLWHTVTPDQDLYVDVIRLWAGGATDIQFGYRATQLTTGNVNGINKNIAALLTSSANKFSTQANAGSLVNTVLYDLFPLPATTLITLPLDKPIKIPASVLQGLTFCALTVNVELRAFIEFREYF